jgi:hypothetical protein
MQHISYDSCNLCRGTGKWHNVTCILCEGFGLHENTDQSSAVSALLQIDGPPIDESVRNLCNSRLQGITPDNFEALLDCLTIKTSKASFDALHKHGSLKWGWAWFHTNRFAVELATLYGIKASDYRYALSMLSSIWLIKESEAATCK